ncbi:MULTISPECIES: thioesterase domain-containing protein [unclassified Kitasatospora]|uniref:thioesterase II family protein n=1 Tax=unclassified Kitasatospora TaxID=2633591 RepID=UPI0033D24BAF
MSVTAARRPLAQGALTIPRPVPGAAVRLFLFHHAGGSHLLYQGWESAFPADWEVCLLDAPGHGHLRGDPLIDTGDGLVDFFLHQLEPWTDRPYAFFGHSMGALVAYELTRRLANAGQHPPVWTGLSSCAAPSPAEQTQAPHPSTQAQLRDWLRSTGGTPAEILDTPCLWRLFEPVLRNDIALVNTWRPAPDTTPLPVAVSAFGGTQDTVVRKERLAAWAAHTQRFHGPHLYHGGHFYLHTHAHSVAGRIIEAVTANRTTPAPPTPQGKPLRGHSPCRTP